MEQKSAPIEQFIREGQAAFVTTYGFPAERIHCSRSFAKALTRWMAGLLQYKGVPATTALEIHGLEVLHMTKQSPHFEFYLSATRDGQVFSSNVRLEPDHPAEGLIQDLQGIVDLTTPDDQLDLDLEPLDSDSEEFEIVKE